MNVSRFLGKEQQAVKIKLKILKKVQVLVQDFYCFQTLEEGQQVHLTLHKSDIEDGKFIIKN